MRVAGIDIGTNTILMLIADVFDDGKIVPIGDYHAIARLGEGLKQTGNISEEALNRGLEILKNFKKEIVRHSVDKVFCVGTSALRDAKNSLSVIEKIESETGLKVKVIDGQFEAYLSFIGTIESDEYSIVFDIGGGSTEIIAGENNQISFRKSFDFGVVKLTEQFIESHPPDEITIKTMKNEISKHFSLIQSNIVKGKIYAVAGTPTTIAAVVLGLKEYDRNKVHNYVLTLNDIRQTLSLFLTLSIDEIISKLHIPPLRADVITAGTIILETFCEYFNLDSVIVSDKGLRYGVVKYFGCGDK